MFSYAFVYFVILFHSSIYINLCSRNGSLGLNRALQELESLCELYLQALYVFGARDNVV